MTLNSRLISLCFLLTQLFISTAHSIDCPLNVSGRNGNDGADGSDQRGCAASQTQGTDGGDAGPSQAGTDAGNIQIFLSTPSPQADDKNSRFGIFTLRGTLKDPSGKVETVNRSMPLNQGGIHPQARGGNGGSGGNGGQGEGGGKGYDGSDATQYSRGTDGGSGSDGGKGGNATSGSNGGSGGHVEVHVDEKDMHLLMLVEDPDVQGGRGGDAGKNGAGGSGGRGGRGGSSHSWQESHTTTDGEGNIQFHTTHHSNPGGSDGYSGRNGANGNAPVENGRHGKSGTFKYVVNSGGEEKAYSSKYNLRLVRFSYNALSENGIYEPGDRVEVKEITVVNSGGMPTPPFQDVVIYLQSSRWVKSDGVRIRIPKSLAPGEKIVLKDSVFFQINDTQVESPGEPFRASDKIMPAAELTEVSRTFFDFNNPQSFEIRYPIEISEISGLNSVGPGQSTRVFWNVKNISTKDFGSESEIRRELGLQFGWTGGEMQAAQLTFTDGSGKTVEMQNDFISAVSTLKAGESVLVEGTLELSPDVLPYSESHFKLGLNVGRIGAPDHLKGIQFRTFSLRAGQVYRKTPHSGLLLLTNHHTTRPEVLQWQAVAKELQTTLDVWDLSYNGYLELMKKVGENDPSLLEDFSGKTIIILDNKFEVSESERSRQDSWSLDFLSKSDFLSAIQRYGVHFYVLSNTAFPTIEKFFIPSRPLDESIPFQNWHEFVAADPADNQSELRAKGISASDSSARVLVQGRKHFAMPKADYLKYKAKKVAKTLSKLHTDRRYLVTYEVTSDGDPATPDGVLRIQRGLDFNESGVVVLKVSDNEIHSPQFIRSKQNLISLIAALPFAEKATLFDRFLGQIRENNRREVSETFHAIKRAILADLANEQKVLLENPWKSGVNVEAIRHKLPRLALLSEQTHPGGPLDFKNEAAKEVLGFIAEAYLMIDHETSWWDHLVPGRRAPIVTRPSQELLKTYLGSWFLAPNSGSNRESKANWTQAKAALKNIVRETETEWKKQWVVHNRNRTSKSSLKQFIVGTILNSTAEIPELSSGSSISQSYKDRILEERSAVADQNEDRRRETKREKLVDNIAKTRDRLAPPPGYQEDKKKGRNPIRVAPDSTNSLPVYEPAEGSSSRGGR